MRYFIFSLFIFLFVNLKVYIAEAKNETYPTRVGVLPPKEKKLLKNKRILFVIAHKNFRDEEYKIPKDIFERLGAQIIVASSDTTFAKGMLGFKAKPDTLLKLVNAEDFNAILFIGGSGSVEYWDSKVAHNLVDRAFANNKVIGAICIAPVILANAGILKGKRATVWEDSDTTKLIFKNKGIKYTGLPVVTAGKIVTANGTEAAKSFAEEIVRLLLKENENNSSESKGGELRD
ncbi:DJ-1/PfpI family protein [candidate division WOR-3 bacterium]|nr:DJ-1/PfpI family protein [candidate division WOR-3 bacterium]